MDAEYSQTIEARERMEWELEVALKDAIRLLGAKAARDVAEICFEQEEANHE